MKRSISPFHYSILRRELIYLEEIGELAPNQAEQLLSQYELENAHKNNPEKPLSLNFIQIISVIGAILIGLGVLSLVASNWSAMSNISKFILLLAGLVASYLFAWWTEDRKPFTSKAFYYIGAFMYGAEIFYIGQLFHLGGDVGNAFFAWSFGVLPLAYYLKDRVLYGAGLGLFYVAIELKFMFVENMPPSLWMLVILPLLFISVRYVKLYGKYVLYANFFLLYQFIEMRWMMHNDDYWLLMIPVIIGLFALHHFVYREEKYLTVINFVIVYQLIEWELFTRSIENPLFVVLLGAFVVFLFLIGHKFMDKSPILFIANVILSIQFFGLTLYHFGIEEPFMYFAILFIIGIFFTHVRLVGYEDVTKWMGYLLQFASGVVLTIPSVYGKYDDLMVWLLFGLLYIGYGFYMVSKNHLFGVLLVGVLIFRFYVDLSLLFMNKSIAFFLGGFLLLGLGYWFEKTRRGEKKHD